ncbi:glycosyltransferase [Algoriphagus machipongonensis]|uniref:PGL/P-HBAD biosynthesis glycosyltransferase n=1 Tax=Algoriphagus machipongonensis TaxID=388413 RepID=A3HRH5_9BACT|nr:glycosyltransferase [Algoriphagus machipongonensis]EAZ82443.1 PGL/P-HBAD biosynthesis glycosyltransferase [Algoriphagus machipongonensis]
MSDRIDLSIIIPNFNSGKFLENTLSSIFLKKTCFSFEVLIIDNNSSDNPFQYVKKFPLESILFCSDKDNGVYEAMNKGVKLAKGNWIIFLGAGDELKVESVNQIEFNPLQNLKLIYGNTLLLKNKKTYDGEFSLLKLMKRNISHQAIFYHHSLFLENGSFDTEYRIAADYMYNLKVFLNTSIKVQYVPLVVSHFLGGGLSDIKRDDLFQENKLLLINKLVLKSLSWNGFISLISYNLYYLKKFIQFRIG